MRISTSQIYQRGTVNMLQQQEKALKLYEQLSSGLRVKIPSDDPIASTQIELMNQRALAQPSYCKKIAKQLKAP